MALWKDSSQMKGIQLFPRCKDIQNTICFKLTMDLIELEVPGRPQATLSPPPVLPGLCPLQCSRKLEGRVLFYRPCTGRINILAHVSHQDCDCLVDQSFRSRLAPKTLIDHWKRGAAERPPSRNSSGRRNTSPEIIRLRTSGRKFTYSFGSLWRNGRTFDRNSLGFEMVCRSS